MSALQRIGELGARLRLRRAMRSSIDAGLVAGGLAVVLVVAGCWMSKPMAWWGPPGMVLAGCVCGWVVAFFKKQNAREIAAELDVLGRTKDRFVTLMSLQGCVAPIEKNALRECEGFALSFDAKPVLGPLLPKKVWVLPLPLITSALLLLHFYIYDPGRRPLTDQELAVEEKAQQMERLADELAKRDSPEGQKLAEELRLSAGRMKPKPESDQSESADAQKRALSEMSRLEQMIEAMRKAGPTKAELAALQQALESQPQTQAAAESLSLREREKAAEQMESGVGGMGGQQASELSQAMQRKADQIPQGERGEISKQMQRAGQAPESQQKQELQQIAKKLRESGKENNQSQGGTKPGQSGVDSETLQKAMNAMRQMKEQGRQGEGQGQGKGDGRGKVQSKDFKKDGSGEPGESGEGDPTGKPGSERDTGTTESPFGKNQTPDAEGGSPEMLLGQMGEGESLSDLLRGIAGGDEKAEKTYRALMEAAEAEAENTVEQEDLPLGRRMIIRKYFESIRSE